MKKWQLTSLERGKVPQWIPMECLALISLWIWTASVGSTCWDFNAHLQNRSGRGDLYCLNWFDYTHRGLYAPIGIAATSKGPRCSPISLKTLQYPVSPPNHTRCLGPMSAQLPQSVCKGWITATGNCECFKFFEKEKLLSIRDPNGIFCSTREKLASFISNALAYLLLNFHTHMWMCRITNEQPTAAVTG